MAETEASSEVRQAVEDKDVLIVAPPQLRDQFEANLQGVAFHYVHSVPEALEAFHAKPDLTCVAVNWQLADGQQGAEIVRMLRQLGYTSPIMMKCPGNFSSDSDLVFEPYPNVPFLAEALRDHVEGQAN